MQQQKRWAVAKVAMHGREHVVLLRPVGRLLAMQFLHYASQVVRPNRVEDQAPTATVSTDEQALTNKLIETKTSARLDFSEHRDNYKDRLRELIEAKVKGKEIVAPAAPEQTPMANLMVALRKSLALEEKPRKPAKKMTPSARKKPARKKSS